MQANPCLTLAGTLWPMFFLANVPASNGLGAMSVAGRGGSAVAGPAAHTAWLGWPAAVLPGGCKVVPLIG